MQYSAIIVLGAAANALRWAHFNAQMQLPIALLGSIIILGTAANALGWAHSNVQVRLPMGLLGL